MTSSRAELRPPGGSPPPLHARIGGERIALPTLAEEAARRHWDEYPDERERYGETGFEWCVHDLQWVLAWAAHDADGLGAVLPTQLAWLARVLAARDYPVERLQRAVEICAEIARARSDAPHTTLADALDGGAASLAPAPLP